MNRRKFIRNAAGLLVPFGFPAIIKAAVPPARLLGFKSIQPISGGTPFTPANLPSIRGWWDCSILGLADGTAVATLPDSSGNAKDFTQSTAPKMIFNTGQQNGLGACTTLTNTPGRFETSTLDMSGTPASYAFIVKTSAAGQVNQIVFGSDGFAGMELRFTNASQKFEFLKSTTASIGLNTTALSYATWYIVIATYDGTNLAWYVNNVADGTASSAQTFNSHNLQLGWDSVDGAATSGAMVFGEACVGGAVWGSTDRSNLYTYWHNKWNV